MRNLAFTLLILLAIFIGSILYISVIYFPRAEYVLLLNRNESDVKVLVLFPNENTFSGLAHYTEHLTWFNKNESTLRVDFLSNAWTNRYAVGYWLSGQPEDLPDILSQLKGVMDPLDLPETFALEERDIVLREYDFRIADNPIAQAAEAMNTFLLADNSIAASVIGTPDDIMAFTYDQAKALHAETHRPDNAVLVITGDVTLRQLNRAMAQADWPAGVPVADLLIPTTLDLAPPATQQFEFADVDAAPRLIWRKVVSLPEPVQFDLLEARTALLADILRANLPGGVAGPLRFDAAIARSFDVNIWPIDEDNIEIKFIAAPDSGVTLTDLKESFTTTFAKIAASGIQGETYARMLARFEDFWPDWDDEDETGKWMADYVLDRVSILRPPLSKRELKRLKGDLSLSTTNSLLQQLSGEGRTAIAYIGPEENFR